MTQRLGLFVAQAPVTPKARIRRRSQRWGRWLQNQRRPSAFVGRRVSSPSHVFGWNPSSFGVPQRGSQLRELVM